MLHAWEAGHLVDCLGVAVGLDADVELKAFGVEAGDLDDHGSVVWVSDVLNCRASVGGMQVINRT